jgi:hypothetical protein
LCCTACEHLDSIQPRYIGKYGNLELKTSMKANHDNYLDDDDNDVKYLAKQHSFFLNNIYEMEIQLSKFTTLLGIYFGPSSVITHVFQKALHHLQRNYKKYCVQSGYNKLCTRVLNYYELGLQENLSLLQDESITLNEIPYDHIKENFK